MSLKLISCLICLQIITIPGTVDCRASVPLNVAHRGAGYAHRDRHVAPRSPHSSGHHHVYRTKHDSTDLRHRKELLPLSMAPQGHGPAAGRVGPHPGLKYSNLCPPYQEIAPCTVSGQVLRCMAVCLSGNSPVII